MLFVEGTGSNIAHVAYTRRPTREKARAEKGHAPMSYFSDWQIDHQPRYTATAYQKLLPDEISLSSKHGCGDGSRSGTSSNPETFAM